MITYGMVREYLIKHYDVSPDEARAAVARHSEIVDEAIRVGSFAYYPGDKIATLEGFEESDGADEDEDEDEES